MNTPVSFELAKLLKEKGFDKATNKSYRISKNPEKPLPTEPIADEITYFPNVRESYSAPTIVEVIMWLYEKHGIWIEVRRTNFFKEIRFQSYINEKPLTGELGGYISHKHPEQAYEAAIEYCLINII